jgi:hypothetical protein
MSLPASRMLTAVPNCTRSKHDVFRPPARIAARTDKRDPMITAPRIETLCLARANPETETDEPTTPVLRRERLEPILTPSRTETMPQTRKFIVVLLPEPSRLNMRIETELLTVMKSSAEMAATQNLVHFANRQTAPQSSVCPHRDCAAQNEKVQDGDSPSQPQHFSHRQA